MVPITQVAKGIYKIGPLETHLRTPATSPHLVVGERAAIIEPGEVGQAPALLEGIREIIGDVNLVDYMIPSHIHLHHVAGVNMLLQEIPNAKVVVHHRGAPHLVEPSRLNAGTFQVWGEGCPVIAPVPEDRVWGVHGGQVLDLGGRELEIIDAVGHAPHHQAIFDRLTRALFTGDSTGVINMTKNRGRPDILPPLHDVEKQVETLHRLRDLNPSVIFVYGYGGVSYEPLKTIQWAEDDVLAVERICLEGMQQKMKDKEIGRRVQEYYVSVGLAAQSADSASMRVDSSGAPIGMVNYLKRKYPDLEMPEGIVVETGTGRAAS